MSRFKKIVNMVRWQKQVRAAVSTHLSMLEDASAFALGGLTDEEGAQVVGLVEEARSYSGPLLEFGTLFGLTTRIMADAKRESRALVTIDNFCWNPFGLTPELHELFTRRILSRELAKGDVSLVVKDSKVFRAQYAGDVPAMVFFDADHSYEAVRDEIAWAKRLQVPLISGHDYGNARFGVTQAVDEAFSGGVRVRGMVWSWRAGEVEPSTAAAGAAGNARHPPAA